jgi:transposase
MLAEKKLLKGTTIGIDATTLEANAALRSIVRRDTGEKVRRVSDAAGEGKRHPDTDQRAVGEAGSQAAEEGIQR